MVVQNKHRFRTTIDRSEVGAALTPGPLVLAYAELGFIAPDASASWNASWNPAQAAQVFIRTTPYGHQTAASPLAARLTRPQGLTWDQPGGHHGRELADGGRAGRNVMGDELATLLTVEGLTLSKPAMTSIKVDFPQPEADRGRHKLRGKRP